MSNSDDKKGLGSLKDIPEQEDHETAKIDELFLSISELQNTTKNQADNWAEQRKELKDTKNQIFALMAMFFAMFTLFTTFIGIQKIVLPALLQFHPIEYAFITISVVAIIVMGFLMLISMMLHPQNNPYKNLLKWLIGMIVLIICGFGCLLFTDKKVNHSIEKELHEDANFIKKEYEFLSHHTVDQNMAHIQVDAANFEENLKQEIEQDLRVYVKQEIKNYHN